MNRKRLKNAHQVGNAGRHGKVELGHLVRRIVEAVARFCRVLHRVAGTQSAAVAPACRRSCPTLPGRAPSGR